MSRRGQRLEPLSRTERGFSLGLGIALNAAALLLLIALRAPDAAQPRQPGEAVVAMVGQIEQPPARPTPLPPSKVVLPNTLSLALSDLAAAQAELGASSLDCGLLDVVAKAVLNDPATMNAVVQAPPETRSVADAIVIWNEGWNAAALEPDGPLAPVRTNVVATLSAASPECLEEGISGPRLVPVANGDRTLFLVFGSGDWSWQSLVDDAAADEPFNLMEWFRSG